MSAGPMPGPSRSRPDPSPPGLHAYPHDLWMNKVARFSVWCAVFCWGAVFGGTIAFAIPATVMTVIPLAYHREKRNRP